MAAHHGIGIQLVALWLGAQHCAPRSQGRKLPLHSPHPAGSGVIGLPGLGTLLVQRDQHTTLVWQVALLAVIPLRVGELSQQGFCHRSLGRQLQFNLQARCRRTCMGAERKFFKLLRTLRRPVVGVIVHQAIQVHHLGDGQQFLEAIEHQWIIALALLLALPQRLARTAGYRLLLFRRLGALGLVLRFRARGHVARQHLAPQGYGEHGAVARRRLHAIECHRRVEYAGQQSVVLPGFARAGHALRIQQCEDGLFQLRFHRRQMRARGALNPHRLTQASVARAQAGEAPQRLGTRTMRFTQAENIRVQRIAHHGNRLRRGKISRQPDVQIAVQCRLWQQINLRR